MLARNILLYGKAEPLPESRILRAGPLSMLYEQGDLRYIRLGEREILRRVYVALRDRNWTTITPQLSNVQIESNTDSFRVDYDVANKQGDIDFIWHGLITGDGDGTIHFSMAGEAHSTFMRNRLGFCVLHPILECAGQPCTVEHADGTVTQTAFPQWIAPHQPFKNISAISHQAVPGLWAEVRFTGDVFETEDQRNWLDASFKTYCTPLALPYPVEVRAGTKISQSVSLRLRGDVPQVNTAESDPRAIISASGSAATRLPRIGLSAVSPSQPLSDKEIVRLKALHLSHLRVDLQLSSPGWEADLRRVAREAAALGVPLEIALFLSDAVESELTHVNQLTSELNLDVYAWFIFDSSGKPTSEGWFSLARQILKNDPSGGQIGGGTNSYFTDMNRNRPSFSLLDRVAYSTNPQVHAFDNLSIIETLETLLEMIASTRQMSGALPISISPITLKPRFNPDATELARELAAGELPETVDVRQMSLFGAVWTLGCLKMLAESALDSVTFFETSGWRGVMEVEGGSSLPEVFHSLPGAVFPMYHVFADVGEFVGGDVIPTQTNQPLHVTGLALRKDGRTRYLLANLSASLQRVMLKGLSEQVSIRQMDETNAEQAMSAPEAFRSQSGQSTPTHQGELEIELRPYAVARIDSVSL